MHALLCFSTPQHTHGFGEIYYQGNHEFANKAKLGYIFVFNVKEIGLSNDSYLMVTRTLCHDHDKSSTTQYSQEIDLSYCSNVEKAQKKSLLVGLASIGYFKGVPNIIYYFNSQFRFLLIMWWVSPTVRYNQSHQDCSNIIHCNRTLPEDSAYTI